MLTDLIKSGDNSNADGRLYQIDIHKFDETTSRGRCGRFSPDVHLVLKEVLYLPGRLRPLKIHALHAFP